MMSCVGKAARRPGPGGAGSGEVVEENGGISQSSHIKPEEKGGFMVVECDSMGFTLC